MACVRRRWCSIQPVCDKIQGSFRRANTQVYLNTAEVDFPHCTRHAERGEGSAEELLRETHANAAVESPAACHGMAWLGLAVPAFWGASWAGERQTRRSRIHGSGRMFVVAAFSPAESVTSSECCPTLYLVHLVPLWEVTSSLALDPPLE
ncbi:hypothetical protein MPTK1_7g03550 [Marchantia polymorpha subsp. ruderalis]|uniref:Uncharacterized protein n=2 Tax=Marchantia polymorpha TaxID=3197 RepID=A0AAF6BVT2_MARPO|nr:hypothetical protein MARPO_0074s0041 [Marchantia polymorpha]BBN16116.1 hypothetical protein Mp_7g03550 [Marchantia polymorpha subsp. ruderalis]|eukprot:PTQ35049.1 hypothetical protein MARPO_0074s0041 [Marchantia polymorpha]